MEPAAEAAPVLFARRPEQTWTYFEQPEQIESLLLYLNPSGPRERQLKERIEVLESKIVTAMEDALEEKEERAEAERESRAAPKLRPPATPPDETTMDKAKDIMVKIREGHVVVDEDNRTHLVSWFKNLLASDKWELLLPLAVELAELVRTHQ